MADNARSMTGPLTPRGVRTKQRIVEAAADIIYTKGVERVSLDEVMEATSTSRSQIYHYFENKNALVREVIAFQASRILETNSAYFKDIESIDSLRVWRDAVVSANRAGGSLGGCPLGSLANELAMQSEQARHQIHSKFLAWGAVIEAGLTRMRDKGKIKSDADTREMAVAILAAVQGGILLSMTARNSRPLELALDMVLSHIERYAT